MQFQEPPGLFLTNFLFCRPVASLLYNSEPLSTWLTEILNNVGQASCPRQDNCRKRERFSKHRRSKRLSDFICCCYFLTLGIFPLWFFFSKSIKTMAQRLALSGGGTARSLNENSMHCYFRFIEKCPGLYSFDAWQLLFSSRVAWKCFSNSAPQLHKNRNLGANFSLN